MKVAYYSPMPPERSGIADYSAHLLPALRERLEVDVVKRGRTRPARGTDLSLYHVGNNPDAHGWIVDALRKRPGVVVLHDFVLHHLVAGLTIGRRDGHGYLDAMEREGGVVGRLLAHGVLDKRIPPLWESRPEDFHLAGEVLELATGLIVHSRHVEERARAAGYEGPVWRIPHPAWEHAPVDPAPITGEPLIGSFGNVNTSKRIPQLLEAFARLRRDRPGARLLLVGAVSPGFDLDRRLQRLGLSEEGIVREAYVEEERLWALMSACDICVNLRSPTMGETSGSVIRQLSLGKPVVVSDVGWFAELPDAVALKVPVDAHETETLHAALELLARDEAARSGMSAAARELARREHDLERTADLYAAALEQAAGGEAVADAVLGDVAARGRRRSGSSPARPRRASSRGASPRSSLADRLRRVPAWAWLAVIVAASFLLRAWLARAIVGPFIMVDELIYSELARSVAAGEGFRVRDVPAGGFSLVYPLLISPAYALFDSLPDAYAAVKTLNALYMSLAAVPAYLLARRLLGPGLSLAAAVLAVAVPSLAYTGTVMTENVFYPLFLTGALVFVLVLERPTALRQAGLLALVGLLFATRVQAVAFVPAILVAPLLAAWLGRQPLVPALKRLWLLYALIGAGAVAVLGFQAVRGQSPRDLLGAYAVVGDSSYDPATVARFFLYHLAELDLYLGVLPLAAFVLLAVRTRRIEPALAPFLAVAITLSTAVLLVVAAFASVFANRIQERNTFVVAPFFLIALLVWADRGLPRPKWVAPIVVAVCALLPLAIPFERFIETGAISDTLALLPLWDAFGSLLFDSIDATVLAGGLVAAALLLLVPRRLALVLPAVTLAFFAAVSQNVWQGEYGFATARVSAGALFSGIRVGHRDWIDRALPDGARAAFIWTGATDRYAVNQNEFFNRAVGPIYFARRADTGRARRDRGRDRRRSRARSGRRTASASSRAMY